MGGMGQQSDRACMGLRSDQHSSAEQVIETVEQAEGGARAREVGWSEQRRRRLPVGSSCGPVPMDSEKEQGKR
jgi:hypothetical protein